LAIATSGLCLQEPERAACLGAGGSTWLRERTDGRAGLKEHPLHAVDIHTWHEKWRFQTGWEVLSSPAVAGGLAYFRSLDAPRHTECP
jgi:hypothetical protein